MCIVHKPEIICSKVHYQSVGEQGEENFKCRRTRSSTKGLLKSFMFLAIVITFLSTTLYFLVFGGSKKLPDMAGSRGFIQLISPKGYDVDESLMLYWYYFSNYSETLNNSRRACNQLLPGNYDICYIYIYIYIYINTHTHIYIYIYIYIYCALV